MNNAVMECSLCQADARVGEVTLPPAVAYGQRTSTRSRQASG